MGCDAGGVVGIAIVTLLTELLNHKFRSKRDCQRSVRKGHFNSSKNNSEFVVMRKAWDTGNLADSIY